MSSASIHEEPVLSVSEDAAKSSRGKKSRVFPLLSTAVLHVGWHWQCPEKAMLPLAATGCTDLGAGAFEMRKGQTCLQRLASQTTQEYVRTIEPAPEEGREGSWGSLGSTDPRWGLTPNSFHCLHPCFLALCSWRGLWK